MCVNVRFGMAPFGNKDPKVIGDPEVSGGDQCLVCADMGKENPAVRLYTK